MKGAALKSELTPGMTNAERAAAHAAFAEKLLGPVLHSDVSMPRAAAHATLAVYYRSLPATEITPEP